MGSAADDRGYEPGRVAFSQSLLSGKDGPVPRLDIELEIAVQTAVRDLIRLGLVRSAHDCSEGGLAVALAECCFNPAGLLGVDVDCGGRPAGDAHASHREAATALFNEVAIAHHHFLRSEECKTSSVRIEI